MATIEFEGQTFDFPDDFTDEEISTALAEQSQETANGGGSPLAGQESLSTAAPGQQVPQQAPPQEDNFITLPSASGKEALLDPGGVIAESVLKGATGLARGVLTFPEDVVRGFAGDDVSEADLFKNPILGLTKTIGDIGRKIPRVRGGSTAGDVGGDIAQFAAPLGPVSKVAKKLFPGKGNALANLAGTSAADVVVADPTQDQSLLESLGVTRDLSPIESRTTIGAEGGVVGGALGTIAAGGRALGRGLRPFTEKGLQKQVAESLQESTTKPVGEVIEDIDIGLARQEPEGFKPTTGTLTGEEGLIGFEKGVASEPELVNRAISNRQALSQEVQRTLQAGGDPADLKLLAEDIVTRKTEAGQASVRNAEQLVTDAKVEVDDLVANIQGSAEARGTASENLTEELQGELQRRTLIKNQKFNNIDPEGNLTINRDLIANLIRKFRPSSPGDISAREFLAESKVAKTLVNLFASKKPVSFKTLNDLRPTISNEIKAARQAGKGDQIEKLTQVKDFLNERIETLASLNERAIKGEFPDIIEKISRPGKRAKDALDFFKKEFAPFFGEGAGKKFRKQARTFDVEPTKTASSFLKSSTTQGGARESSQQLASIIENTPEPQAAKQAVRDFIVEDLGASLANKNPEQTLKAVRGFIQKNADNLDAFPDVAKEINSFADGLEGGLSRVNKLGDEVLDVKAAVKEVDKTSAKSAFSKLAKADDPVKTIDGILKSNTGKTDFDKLFVSTQGNKAARDGLKASLSESLTDRIINTVKSVEGEVSASQLNKVLKDKNIQNALNKTYKKSELANLKRVQDRIREMERINTQVTNTSQTAGLTISSQRIANLFASVYGIAKGRGLFTISKIISEAIGGNPSEKMKRIVARSMIDPEFAKMLLSKKVGDSNKEARRVALYTINNIFTDERDNGLSLSLRADETGDQ